MFVRLQRDVYATQQIWEALHEAGIDKRQANGSDPLGQGN